MPKYVYFCDECKKCFETKHSIQKTCTICELCGHEGQLDRRPSLVFITKKQSELAGNLKPGEVIRATIEETRQDIMSEQEQLKKKECIKNDDINYDFRDYRSPFNYL